MNSQQTFTNQFTTSPDSYRDQMSQTGEEIRFDHFFVPQSLRIIDFTEIEE